MVLNLCKWGLDRLTQHYPEQTISDRDQERVEKLHAMFKRWVTAQPETPQLAFLRMCDILGLDPADAKRELLKALS
jgi:hypothetical protein